MRNVGATCTLPKGSSDSMVPHARSLRFKENREVSQALDSELPHRSWTGKIDPNQWLPMSCEIPRGFASTSRSHLQALFGFQHAKMHQNFVEFNMLEIVCSFLVVSRSLLLDWKQAPGSDHGPVGQILEQSSP